MAVLTADVVKTRVLEILPISDSELYSPQMNILIRGAISKMRNEGVDIAAKDSDDNYIFTDADDCYMSDDYVICVGYQIMKDIDFDSTATNYLTEQYITRVNTLRCNLTVRQR